MGKLGGGSRLQRFHAFLVDQKVLSAQPYEESAPQDCGDGIYCSYSLKKWLAVTDKRCFNTAQPINADSGTSCRETRGLPVSTSCGDSFLTFTPDL